MKGPLGPLELTILALGSSIIDQETLQDGLKGILSQTQWRDVQQQLSCMLGLLRDWTADQPKRKVKERENHASAWIQKDPSPRNVPVLSSTFARYEETAGVQ